VIICINSREKHHFHKISLSIPENLSTDALFEMLTEKMSLGMAAGRIFRRIIKKIFEDFRELSR
jgi:hypothetical protein